MALALWFGLPELVANAPNLNVVIGREREADFLRPRVGPYACFEYLDAHAAPDARVLMVYTNFVYHCPRPCVADSAFEASRLVDGACDAGDAAALAAAIRDEWRCDYVLANRPILDLVSQEVERRRTSENQWQADYRRGVETINELLKSGQLSKVVEANEHELYRMR